MHIYGTVTGVGFRAWTKRQARSLGVTGFVRNVSRETVEIVAEGDEGNLQTLLTRCKSGPELSWVENIEVTWGDTQGEYAEFTIRYN